MRPLLAGAAANLQTWMISYFELGDKLRFVGLSGPGQKRGISGPPLRLSTEPISHLVNRAQIVNKLLAVIIYSI